MDTSYPGIVISDMAHRRNRWFLPFMMVFIGISVVFVVSQGIINLAQGDTASTVPVYAFDVPTWALGAAGLALMVYLWRSWRKESEVILQREGLINIQPVQGGLYLVGNYRAAEGVTLPVADNSPLRVGLVKTGRVAYGLIKVYGLRMTSNYGDVLMDLQLMPKALDLSPLLAELRRRRIALDLDPALEARHDHGAAPHVAPPSGPVNKGYQAGSPQASQPPSCPPQQANQGWNAQ